MDFLNLTERNLWTKTTTLTVGRKPSESWRIDFTVNKLSAVPALVALGRLRFACFATNEITSLEVGFVGSC